MSKTKPIDSYNGKSISSLMDECWDEVYQDAILPIEDYRKKAHLSLYIYRAVVALLLAALLMAIVPIGLCLLAISIVSLHLNIIVRYIEKIISIYCAIIRADFIKTNIFNKVKDDFEENASNQIYEKIGIKKDGNAYYCVFGKGLEAICEEYEKNNLKIDVPFVREFQSKTVVSSKDLSRKELKSFNKSIGTDFKEVSMDNPDFNKKYYVLSQDITDAHFILSQDFMERLLDTYISMLYFSNGRMVIYSKDTLSWFYLKSMENVFDEDLLSKERIKDCLLVFARIDEMVRHLQLDDGIWK